MSATDFVYDVHMVFIGFLGCSLCCSDVHWSVELFLGIILVCLEKYFHLDTAYFTLKISHIGQSIIS